MEHVELPTFHSNELPARQESNRNTAVEINVRNGVILCNLEIISEFSLSALTNPPEMMALRKNKPVNEAVAISNLFRIDHPVHPEDNCGEKVEGGQGDELVDRQDDRIVWLSGTAQPETGGEDD